MFRLITATCPGCQNRFHAGGEVADPADGREYRCRCPRCCADIPVPVAGGVPQPGPVEWAIVAVPTG